MTTIEERYKLLADATKLPWKWEDGWKGILPTMAEEGSELFGNKYLDLQLVGSNGYQVLPLIVDHYEYFVDFEDGKPAISEADRRLIEDSVNSYPLFLELLAAAESAVLMMSTKNSGELRAAIRRVKGEQL